MFRKKKESNALLRYGVLLCEGKCCKCSDNVRFALILRIKDDLESMGAFWQVERLKNHLHKALGQGFMTLKDGEGGD